MKNTEIVRRFAESGNEDQLIVEDRKIGYFVAVAVIVFERFVVVVVLLLLVVVDSFVADIYFVQVEGMCSYSHFVQYSCIHVYQYLSVDAYVHPYSPKT